MSNPMSNYSDDAKDFLKEYKTKSKSQSYEDHYDIIKEFGENYERAYQQLNTFYAEAYRDLSYSLGRLFAQYKSSLIDLKTLLKGNKGQAKAA